MVLALASCGIGALEATILADTNRDGKVDVQGKTDMSGKEIWTDGSGALFLPNIADTNGRCSSKITDDTSNKELDMCNDASDNVQRNPKYLAPVRTVPNPRLGDGAVGSVLVVESAAAALVRIFRKDRAGWEYVPANYTFTARALREGLHLGVDGRQVRTTAWDGRATIEFTVRDGRDEAKDRVALRVAPVLTHHHGQRAEQVLASAGDGTGRVQDKFVQDLTRQSARARVRLPLFAVNTTDIWTQDFFEPGYSSIPGPDGPVVLRIMIRSAQQEGRRVSGRIIYRELRSDTVGAVQQHVHGGTTDSMGNLETIPPHAHNGKSYPAGRAIVGSKKGVRPFVFHFLNAQEVQAPVEIDTTWLQVGHTDEFLQFLPAMNARGWLMMVSDPVAGLERLRVAQRSGHGSVSGFSRPRLSSDGNLRCSPTETIDDILGKANFSKVQEFSARNIEANVNVVKRETGIVDRDIIRVPTLFATMEQFPSCQLLGPIRAARAATILEVSAPRPIGRRHASNAVEVGAFYPNVINGVVMSDSQYVAPNPWGPVIDGQDILAAAVSAVYARANYTVTFMDDWFSHHLGFGEVHCGSNAVRDASARWW
ncbi:hypothetical protein RJ55_06406 [Drechmeria coniospora]|nr:hypothetical protein RJ55_06406 [Drechmeria coniospora]